MIARTQLKDHAPRTTAHFGSAATARKQLRCFTTANTSGNSDACLMTPGLAMLRTSLLSGTLWITSSAPAVSKQLQRHALHGHVRTTREATGTHICQWQGRPRLRMSGSGSTALRIICVSSTQSSAVASVVADTPAKPVLDITATLRSLKQRRSHTSRLSGLC